MKPHNRGVSQKCRRSNERLHRIRFRTDIFPSGLFNRTVVTTMIRKRMGCSPLRVSTALESTSWYSITLRRTAKINASIYLPFVVSCEPVEQSNHERKMEAITASIHPSTSSGRTEAVAKMGCFIFAVRLSITSMLCARVTGLSRCMKSKKSLSGTFNL